MWFQKPPLGTPLDWRNPLNDETVLALAMNEGHGDKVQDLSMNGNHGTLNNFAFPPTVASGWNPGQTGVALKFNSGNDYIDCGNNPSLNIVDELTISTIINVDVGAGDGYILSKNSLAANDSQYSVFWGSNRVYGYLDGGAVGASAVASVLPGQWNHIAMCYNKTDVRYYVNGVLSGTPFAKAGSLSPTAFSVNIGRRKPNNLYIDGYIDQPRIQSRVWTAKEVKDYAINPWQVYLDE